MKNTNAAILELSNVGIGLPSSGAGQWAVRDISLTIESITISFVGESGSGKTSLIMLIAGLEKAIL